MHEDSLVFSIALIFSSAAVLGTLAMYARQSLIVVYMLLGMFLGPFGAQWVEEQQTIESLANLGVALLLFLIGLNLHPQKLLPMLKNALWIMVVSSCVFFAGGFAVALAIGLTWQECLIVGVCMTFSSTIIALKLLPGTDLYRERVGEIIISVLLLQDLLAIVVLLFLKGASREVDVAEGLAVMLLALPGLFMAALMTERLLFDRLVSRFHGVREYVFLLAVGWCLGIASLAEWIGLSAEVGAFLAGVAMATSRASRFIARRLQPLRDFFLVLFFFGLGASINIPTIQAYWMPALGLAVFMLLIKPWLFNLLLQRANEDAEVSGEVGLRMGQTSEFSLLVAYLALQTGYISQAAGDIIQFATVITFMVSSYIVNMRLATPNFPYRAQEGKKKAAEQKPL